MKPMVKPVSRNQSSGIPDVPELGFRSALVVMLTAVLFGGAVLLGFFGISSQVFAYFVCLILAPAFVVMIACIHYQAPPEKRIWSNVALCFSVIYAALTGIVYYVQVSAARGAGAELLPFVFTPGTVFFAVDMLGYGFMCLATWFTAGVFSAENRLTLWIRRLSVLHGWLYFPTVIVPMLLPEPSISAGGADANYGRLALLAWCLVFVPLSFLIARYFRAMRPLALARPAHSTSEQRNRLMVRRGGRNRPEPDKAGAGIEPCG